MDKNFSNSIIIENKSEFMELFLGLKISVLDLLLHLQSYQYVQSHANEEHRRSIDRDNLHQVLDRIFNGIVVYLNTNDFVKILNGYPRHFQRLAQKIKDKWNRIFFSIQNYHTNQTKYRIDCFEIRNKNDEIFSINKQNISLLVQNKNWKQLATKLTYAELFRKMSSEERLNIILSNSKEYKTWAIDEMLYLWSCKRTIFQNHLLLKLDCKIYNSRLSFIENLYIQNTEENSFVSLNAFQFFVYYDQFQNIILLIDSFEYLMENRLNTEAILEITSHSQEKILKRIWSTNQEIIDHCQNPSTIFKVNVSNMNDTKKNFESFSTPIKTEREKLKAFMESQKYYSPGMSGRQGTTKDCLSGEDYLKELTKQYEYETNVTAEYLQKLSEKNKRDSEMLQENFEIIARQNEKDSQILQEYLTMQLQDNKNYAFKLLES